MEGPGDTEPARRGRRRERMPDILTLPNGLRVLLIPVPHAHSVSMSMYVAAGSRYEQPAEAGLSHFVEHICFKGTERRPRPQDIAVEIDAVGGSMNAATERELTVYYAKVTPEHLDHTLDVLTDMLRHSLCLPEEAERERGVILEELAAVEDSPDEQSGILLSTLLWPEQAHGRDIAGSPETVRAITPERLAAYYHEQYVPNATVVSIAGALDPATARTLVERTLGDWAPGTPADWLRARPQPIGPRGGLLAKETEQAHIAIGLRGLSIEDPDRYALGLLSTILGEGMSSRLFTRLREELGLCYDVHSYAANLRDVGSFGVYAGVDPRHAPETIAEISSELRRIRGPVTDDELARAKALARSRVLLRMEDTRAVSGWYGARAILDQPLVDPVEVIAAYDAQRVEDLERVAERILRDAEAHLAVVGPFESIEPLEASLSLAP